MRDRAQPGTITASDEVQESYYGLPVIKAPHWRWLVITYFFLGGVAGGSFSISVLADLFARDKNLARIAHYVSVAAGAPTPLLLALDLGRPERALHMFRILKLRSAMSLGSWALLGMGGCVGVLGTLQFVTDVRKRDVMPKLRRFVGISGLPFALFVTGYTGVLLAVTNVPLWARNYLLLGPTFVCSAFSSSFAAIALALRLSGDEREDTTRKLARAEAICLATELGFLLAGLARLGKLGKPLTHSRWAALFWPVTVGLGTVSPLITQARIGFGGRAPDRRSSILVPLLTMLGSFSLRTVMIFAGRDSARDPSYYFEYTKGDR